MNKYGQFENAGQQLYDFIQTCEILFWVSIIINVIILICFFVLCSNVAKIKKKATDVERFEARFNFLYGIGELEEAKKLLLMKVQIMENLDEAFFCKENYRENSRTVIRKKFKPYFDRLGLQIDYEKVDALIVEQIKEKKD